MHLVVLQFENDQEALRLVDELLVEGTQLQLPSSQEWTSTSIVGLFRAPTKFCDNSDGHRGTKTSAGWTRGRKYGWWVCGKCKRPTQSWSSNIQAVVSATHNLLTSRISKDPVEGSTETHI